MKNYDRKVKQTRILLSDYLLLKGYAQEAGVSMSEALHSIITREWAMAKRKARVVTSARIPVSVTARTSPPLVATATLGSTNARLRATVAKGGSTNGGEQV